MAPQERWGLFRSGCASGEVNMSIDNLLLMRAINGEIQPTLRFFDWERPTITIGYGQPRTDIDFEKLSLENIDFAVRPTGGRAVLHWNELTYSVIIPPEHEFAKLSVTESYRVLSSALAHGLKLFGLDVDVAKGTSGGSKNPSCFSSTSRYEVTCGGLKLVGSAQRRKRGAILQQGSIPISPAYRRLSEFLINSPEEDLAEKSTCISENLNNPIHKELIAESIIKAFKEVFELSFDEMPNISERP